MDLREVRATNHGEAWHYAPDEVDVLCNMGRYAQKDQATPGEEDDDNEGIDGFTVKASAHTPSLDAALSTRKRRRKQATPLQLGRSSDDTKQEAALAYDREAQSKSTRGPSTEEREAKAQLQARWRSEMEEEQRSKIEEDAPKEEDAPVKTGKKVLNYDTIEEVEEAAAQAQTQPEYSCGQGRERGQRRARVRKSRRGGGACKKGGGRNGHEDNAENEESQHDFISKGGDDDGEEEWEEWEEEEWEEEWVEEQEVASTATKRMGWQGNREGRGRNRQVSGYHGVTANGKGWQAQVKYDGKQHYLGTFDTTQEAALAYDREARKSGGGGNMLNYGTIEEAEEAAAKAQREYSLPRHQRARPSSGYYGVSAYRKRWKARIKYDSKNHHLGCFNTKQEAALAYDKEVRKRGREHAKALNYDTVEEAEEAAAKARVEYGPARQRARPASGYYGVYMDGKRWGARVNYGSKQHSLGSFNSKQEAALVHDKELRKRGEEGKMLNYDTIEEAEEAAAKVRVEYCPARQRARPASGYYGVYVQRKRWGARVNYGSKQHSLGSFNSKQEAALAYDKELRKRGEEGKLLNYDTIEEAEEAAAQA
jgi:hypothetical protein